MCIISFWMPLTCLFGYVVRCGVKEVTEFNRRGKEGRRHTMGDWRRMETRLGSGQTLTIFIVKFGRRGTYPVLEHIQ